MRHIPQCIRDAAARLAVTDDTCGGLVTHDLDEARLAHEERGGYLLQIGESPAGYAVCTEAEAIDAWGRTPENLAALAPSYAEA